MPSKRIQGGMRPVTNDASMGNFHTVRLPEHLLQDAFIHGPDCNCWRGKCDDQPGNRRVDQLT
jgi:hypothetical protein